MKKARSRPHFDLLLTLTGAPRAHNEKEAIESKERGTPDIFYGDLLPACGMLPTLQLPCLYGSTASPNTITITKSDNN